MLDWQGHSGTHIARTLRVTGQTRPPLFARQICTVARWGEACRMTAPWPKSAPRQPLFYPPLVAENALISRALNRL